MINTKIIIMAEGRGERWNVSRSAHALGLNWLPEYKHWLDVGGESLIGRTVRLLGEEGANLDNAEVIAPQAFKHVCRPIIVRTTKDFYWNAEPRPILEGIAAAQPWWGHERTLFIMGDVLFSRDLIKIMLDRDYLNLNFYGRKDPNTATGKGAPEIFAFAMGKSFYNEIHQACRKLTARDKNQDAANLWALHNLGGVEINEALFYNSVDFSDDIDSPEEYKEFWPALQHAAYHDK